MLGQVNRRLRYNQRLKTRKVLKQHLDPGCQTECGQQLVTWPWSRQRYAYKLQLLSAETHLPTKSLSHPLPFPGTITLTLHISRSLSRQIPNAVTATSTLCCLRDVLCADLRAIPPPHTPERLDIRHGNRHQTLRHPNHCGSVGCFGPQRLPMRLVRVLSRRMRARVLWQLEILLWDDHSDHGRLLPHPCAALHRPRIQD